MLKYRENPWTAAPDGPNPSCTISGMRPNSAAIDAAHKPKLRNFLSAEPDGDAFALFDPRGVGGAVKVSPLALHIVSKFFDGTRTFTDLRAEILRQVQNVQVEVETLLGLARSLDEVLLLDGPQFRDLIERPVRQPSCIGTYHADPIRLRAQLERLFTAPGGPGLPALPKQPQPGGLRALLVPHMDYTRGNISYGWGFKELEHTDASLFVIIATSHHSPERFTLTRQHFETPLGVVETDQPYVDRIVKAYGDGLFNDPVAHLPEHSVELEVVLLQYLFEGVRPIRIVPLVVGSYADCIEGGTSPNAENDVARMIAALQQAEAEVGETVCYIISGDLAHIGPKFGDSRKVGKQTLATSRAKDEAILERALAADAKGYFDVIASESDRRRICGLPPTYLTLEVAKPKRGKLLHYQQFVHPEGEESVSFASMAFEG